MVLVVCLFPRFGRQSKSQATFSIKNKTTNHFNFQRFTGGKPA
jgi:hypothetical protein